MEQGSAQPEEDSRSSKDTRLWPHPVNRDCRQSHTMSSSFASYCCDKHHNHKQPRKEWACSIIRKKAGTRGVNLKAEPETGHGGTLLNGFLPSLVKNAFLYNPGPPAEGGLSTIGWALPYLSLIKKMSHTLAYRPI